MSRLIVALSKDYTNIPAPEDPLFREIDLEKIEAPLAWEHFAGSAGIAVGVIDGGIDYYHPYICSSGTSMASPHVAGPGLRLY